MSENNFDLDAVVDLKGSITLGGETIVVPEPTLRQVTQLSLWFMQAQSSDTPEEKSKEAEDNMDALYKQMIPELEEIEINAAIRAGLFNLIQSMVNPKQNEAISDETLKKVLGLAT